MSERTLVVRLLHQGKERASVAEEALQEPIVIGRGKECDWITPDDDSTIGREHAILLRKGRHLYLEDHDSLNGTLLRGRKISSVRLKPGQRFQMGSCVVEVVRKGKQQARARRPPPVLKICTGRMAGKWIKLDKETLRIGADPKSELFLMDDLLVSRAHALVGTSGNGAFWIEDCHSQNGTCVNGEPLPPGKRRPLKNGDTIQIAHVEMRFMDGSTSQMMRRIGLSLLVVVATALALWGGLKMLDYMRLPPADQLLAEVREAASREQFKWAQTLLDKAPKTRGYHNLKEEFQTLQAELSLWSKAAALWTEVEKMLTNEDFWREWSSNGGANGVQDLSKKLNALNDMHYRALEWQNGGGWRLGIVRQARGILQEVMLPLQAELAGEPSQREQQEWLKRIVGLLGKGTNQLAAVSGQMSNENSHADHLVHPVACCQKTMADGDDLLREWDLLDITLLRLADKWQWPPPIREVSAEIDRLRQSRFASIRRQAERYQHVLGQFTSFFNEMTDRVKHAYNLDYEKALLPIPLPSDEDVALAPVFGVLRDKCDNSSKKLTRQVNLAQSLQNTIDNHMGLVAIEAQCKKLQEPDVLDRIRACSELEGPFPKSNRTLAVGTYDEILGIEAFYEYLRDGQDWLLATSWTPQIFVLQKALNAVDDALAELARDEMKWLTAGGQAAETLRALQRIADFRDAFVRRQTEDAQKRTGRDALISAGIALILQRDDGSDEAMGRQELVKRLMAKMNNELIVYRDRYDRASAEEKIRIRDEVLAKGLPGHSVVKQMWLRRQN